MKPTGRTCSTGFGGPVTVSSDNPVIGSQRVKYYSSFNEVAAVPSTAAALTQVFPYYDDISAGVNGDNIHVVNPNATQADFTIALGGSCGTGSFSLAAHTENYYSCPTGQGGPVTITSTNAVPIIASQRVKFYQSFNEVAAF